MRWAGVFIEYLFGIVLFLCVAGCAYLYLAPTFGASATGDSRVRILASPNFNGKQFVNPVPTEIDTRGPDDKLEIGSYLWPPAGKNPQSPLPSVKFNRSEFSDGKFVWLGHSTVMFNASDKIVLIDPVFHRASPLPVFGKPFEMTVTNSIDDLPSIDVVLISHDHYDHLDHLAIAKLNASTARFLVPLGLAAHLHRWGVPMEKITELDWYQTEMAGGVEYTLTPSRHFSGRGFTNRKSTLWGSWAIKTSALNIWFSGDGGYFPGLKDIGETYGPFDIAFIENGAYNTDWAEIHMMPEQAVQASVDVRAKVFFPIHWGKFDLAEHTWDEPVRRATTEANRLVVPVLTPAVGKIFALGDEAENNGNVESGAQWWQSAGQPTSVE